MSESEPEPQYPFMTISASSGTAPRVQCGWMGEEGDILSHVMDYTGDMATFEQAISVALNWYTNIIMSMMEEPIEEDGE